jgi:general secretion pathway protein C
VPSIKDGKANGFKIFAIRPGTLYERLGVRNGDVITSINGHKLTTPDEALAAYQNLRDSTSFRLEVRRRGKPLTLTYRLE